MAKGMGILCMLLGAACLLGAIGFVVYNHWEAESAADASKQLLADVQSIIEEKPQTDPEEDTRASESTVYAETPTEPAVFPMDTPKEMKTAVVDGYECIGILSIPVLELEFPVLTPWGYAKLKKAPCHYYGSCYEPDFVIAGHNYPSHFGRLPELRPGDLILFTDMSGIVYCYEVVLLETLPPEATGEMITSGFDLSLYTCTPGGANRVTVRCRSRVG